MGVPVISTAISGIPELVENGVTGLLVPPRDPQALARALETVLGDKALASRLAAHGRDRVRRNFDARRTTESLHWLFAQLLGPGRALTHPVPACNGQQMKPA